MATSLYDIPLKRIDGTDASLGDYRGFVLLVVNVASKCGLTPQYNALEKLHESYQDHKFSVLGFPANDFAGQEPGSNEEILVFCRTNFGVQFPLFAKITVTGEAKHPLYKALITAKPVTPSREKMETALRGYKIETTAAPEVLWNFEKFLISRAGQVVARFAPDTVPDAPEIVQAIESELAR